MTLEIHMPRWRPEIRERLLPLHLDRAREDAIVEELAQHLDDLYHDLIASGLSPAQAELQTRAQLAEHDLLATELHRIEPRAPNEPIVLGTNQRGNMLAELIQDLRYGARLLARSPGFTLVALLSLALGIGANTAIFSLIDNLLIRNMPVADPSSLVQLKSAFGSTFGMRYDGYMDREQIPGLRVGTSFTYETFEELKKNATTLSDLLAFAPIEQLNVNADGRSEIASGLVATGNYYELLGVRASQGRLLTTSDDRADAPAIAILSSGYWQRRFGGDPSVVGKQININNTAFTIAGITAESFKGTFGGLRAPDVTIALAHEPSVRFSGSALREKNLWWLLVMGRLKPGTARAQVQDELAASFQASAMAHRNVPLTNPQAQVAASDMPRLLVAPGGQGDSASVRGFSSSLYLLMAIVSLVLLIACANVANLLLARASARRKEIAVRLALGAGRARLMRQLLTESGLLSVTGGVLGIAFAIIGRDLLTRYAFSSDDRLAIPTGVAALDLRVLTFTLTVSLLTGLLFGFAPAWQATRIDLSPTLKDSGRTSGGERRARLSRLLVIVQVSLSLLLLIGAGLFIRTLRNLQQVDAGFQTKNLLLFRVDPRLSGYQNEQINTLYQRLFARIEAVPGVISATFSRHPLLAGSSGTRAAHIAGHTAPPTTPTFVHIVRANFLETMDIPLLQGRSLREQDNNSAPKVAVVNQAFVQRYFKDQNPMGQRFGFSADTASTIEIVGISRDAKYNSLRQEMPPTIYVPWLQEGRVGQMNLELKTVGEPLLALAAIRQAIQEVDSNLPIFDVRTQVEQAEISVAQERGFAGLLTFFGGLALLLATMGLYGVLSASVAQRTREMGIRTALGAQSRDVLNLIIRQGMRLAVIGVVLGLVAAYATTRLIASFLYGVGAGDWTTFAAISALLLAIALIACWIPARRATKVDPIVALRCE